MPWKPMQGLVDDGDAIDLLVAASLALTGLTSAAVQGWIAPPRADGLRQLARQPPAPTDSLQESQKGKG
jgi:hypothetical protein